MAVAATHVAADENTKPCQYVWHPFLHQLTVFGKHLDKNREKLYKVKAAIDLLAMNREVSYLAGFGIEGEHYIIPEGEEVPQAIPPVTDMSVAAIAEKYGFGSYWQMPVSSSLPLLKATQAMYEKYVFAEDAIYSQDKIDYFFPVVTDRVTDENGENVQVQTRTPWFDMVVAIMVGTEPIEYYDEWLEYYYDSGGREWEDHATKLYLPK